MPLTNCRSHCSFQSTPSGGKATFVTVITRSFAPVFQSTPSGGKATPASDARLRLYNVSIHAFRGEGDALRKLLPRAAQIVSIHAFRGEGDYAALRRRAGDRGFNPRLPGGRRLGGTYYADLSDLGFNPRLPGGRRPSLQRNV